MAKINIPCLVPKTNKAGITSWFWQPSATLKAAGWKSVPLGKDMRSAITTAEERNREVDLWKVGGSKRTDVQKRAQIGTFSALIERYRKDKVQGIDPLTGQRFIKPATAETYEVQMKRLDLWAGKHPIAFITPKRVKALRNALVDPATGIGHSAAHNTLKVLRQIFTFAESEDIIAPHSNPAKNFDLGAPPSRRGVWEADDEAAFIAAAYAAGRPSMALAMKLAIYTAQREADLILMTEAQVQPLEIFEPFAISRLGDKDGIVRGWVLTQGKSKGNKGGATQMEIPLEPSILAEVDAALRANRARDRPAKRLLSYVLIDDATGLPWHIRQDGEVRKGAGSRREFHKAWSSIAADAAKATGRTHITDLVWHDLRRTRVVRLRRRGMRTDQIASITGHSPQSIEMMLKVYGPIDPTITAAAIAGTLPAQLQVAEKEEKQA